MGSQAKLVLKWALEGKSKLGKKSYINQQICVQEDTFQRRPERCQYDGTFIDPDMRTCFLFNLKVVVLSWHIYSHALGVIKVGDED